MPVTKLVEEILTVIEGATPEEPVWLQTIYDGTGRGPASVDPALDRLETAGWVEAYWETPEPAGRPRRRYYRLTEPGDQSLRRVRQPQSRPWWRFRTGPAAS